MSRYRRDISGSDFAAFHRFRGVFHKAAQAGEIGGGWGSYYFPRWSQSRTTLLWSGPIYDKQYDTEIVTIEKKTFIALCATIDIKVKRMIEVLTRLSVIAVDTAAQGGPSAYHRQENGRQYVIVEKKHLYEQRRGGRDTREEGDNIIEFRRVL